MIAVWVDSIDFSKGDKAFIYPDGNHLIIQDDDNVDTYALCTHSMVNGYFSKAMGTFVISLRLSMSYCCGWFLLCAM